MPDKKAKGYSRETLFGTIVHYDSHGHKTGESRPGFFGGWINYNESGQKVSTTYENLFGTGTYTKDTQGKTIGHSHENLLGGTYFYDANRHKIGESRDSFWGGSVDEGYFANTTSTHASSHRATMNQLLGKQQHQQENDFLYDGDESTDSCTASLNDSAIIDSGDISDHLSVTQDVVCDENRINKRIRKMMVCIMAGLAIIVLAVSFAYSSAVTMVCNGEYDTAKVLLSIIRPLDIGDTRDLYHVCEAYHYHTEWLPLLAYREVQNVKLTHLSAEQRSKIESFIEMLRQTEEKSMQSYRQAETKRLSLQETTDIPYVGMSESMISSTRLGRPSSEVRHNRQVKNGQQLMANLYDFYRAGKLIFTARCVEGVVTQVWDKR